MRKFAIVTAAILAAVLVWLTTTLPPKAAHAEGAIDDRLAGRTVRGAFHVHSSISDGADDRAAIAAAAARAGLRFVVFADHGDGTRRPEPPIYRDGVLCVDAVEISTNGGHYVALDMPQAPYPLGGEAAAVVEDVRRLGGFGIAAHPTSSKPELRWTDWTIPLDGVEWLNADSEWRDEPRSRLLRAAFDYLIRPAEALASTFDRPVDVLAEWDRLGGAHRVVGLAAHDAHGGIARRVEDGREPGWLRIPSYESSFRSFAVRAMTAEPFSGDAQSDARRLIEAIRSGHVFSAIDALASPAFLEFHSTGPDIDVQMGESHPFVRGLTVTARSTLPPGGRLVLIRDGMDVAESSTGELIRPATDPGVYRVEVRSPTAPGVPGVPWIVSNAIYLEAERGVRIEREPLFEWVASPADDAWAIEAAPGSTATLSRDLEQWQLDFRLDGGERSNQYVAVAAPLSQHSFEAITFVGWASGPMRVSVQLRVEGRGGARWVSSVYLSPEPRLVSVPVERLVAADLPRSERLPETSAATALLFVVDLTNAAPGSAGSFAVSSVALTRSIR